eukprot:TRINITY_DN2278_c2_g1_i2.p1 TRINITY_DN2278_c2_g1~~TRINITY_DN2278_c2_g1_i2.p1  ORF type:complete len:1746 (+),score=347.53 TRINITY_DN2278_c2_g1_i2:477-5240(+)
MGAQVPGDEALVALEALGSLLERPGGATSHELESEEIPQAIVALLDSGALSGERLATHLGAAPALVAALLRLVESTEALAVETLPPYLSRAPGLRVLSEPMVLGLAGPRAEVRRWLQIEPLLRVSELERAVLLTTPVLDWDFLAWCVAMVGREVRGTQRSVLPGSGQGGSSGGSSGSTSGRVVGFRLATPLRLPVHTLRRNDGTEVDLLASVHGLAAVEATGAPAPAAVDSPEVRLRVALLRLEAASTVESEQAATLKAIQEAAAAGRAYVGTGGDGDAPALSTGCEEVLRELGFIAPASGPYGLWTCPSGSSPSSGLLMELASDRDGRVSRAQTEEADGMQQVEPDPAMVAELAGVFSENAARRACVAVRNVSSEAAMEWACLHQGDDDFHDPLPCGKGGYYFADPRAPVWSVFVSIPPGIPFELVWPELEDPVKSALTSVANAWTAMGWAGGEAEMRETLRAQVAAVGEGPIARGLVRAKAERVASRLRNACACRVHADPEGAAHAPTGGRSSTAGAAKSLEPGARVQLVLEAEQRGFVAVAGERELVVVTDDGRLLQGLTSDQVRLAQRLPPLPPGAERPRNAAAGPAGAQASSSAPDAGLGASAVAEPLEARPLVPLQRNFEALDRAAQESDVVRRLQPSDLLSGGEADASAGAGEAATPSGAGGSSSAAAVAATEADAGNGPLLPAPTCRVALARAGDSGGIARDAIYLLRGERASIQRAGHRGFSSTAWLTAGLPRLAVSEGSWYYEVELNRMKNPQIGWADTSFRCQVGAYADDGIGDDAVSWAADGERVCLWHEGCAGEWRSARAGQTIGCAIAVDAGSRQTRFWFAVDGVWDSEPAFSGSFTGSGLFPAASGELEALFRLTAEEMRYGPPGLSFRPIGECLACAASFADDESPSAPRILPPEWTMLRGLYELSAQGLPDRALPQALSASIVVSFPSPTASGEEEAETVGLRPLSLRSQDLELGLPLRLSDDERDQALLASGLGHEAARAALRVLRELRAEDAVVGATTGIGVPVATGSPTAAEGLPGAPTEEKGGSSSSSSGASRGNAGSRRLGTKLGLHLGHPLACCAGAYPTWCRELPVLAPWLFQLEAREALLRCSAFGVTFAVRWLQERAVEERFAERRRGAEGRLAQAKQIGDATLLNGAYELLFELQYQIARDPEAWVGSLKPEIAWMERERILTQATRAMELTYASPCVLEVQFEGESGFGRAVTQGFYTLVAHELQRRASNREVPMWVEDDPPLNEEFLRPRRGLLVRPLAQDDARLPAVERRFRMLGRLMAKALREGFVVPLPLTATFFKLLLGGPCNPLTMLPGPGDGVAGEFVGACAHFVADAAAHPSLPLPEALEALAQDPEWSKKYLSEEEASERPPQSFQVFAELACFVETGLGGAPLCPDGEQRTLDAQSAPEFVRLATEFWLDRGIDRQLRAIRRGLYDVLGEGAVNLWAFSALELRRLFCGEDEVTWTETELAEHLHCGGGYSSDSEPVRWLREELLEMPQPLRAKFLDFVTSCPRLPPGGLRELQLGVHPDSAGDSGLPRSRACAHRLFLPRYASREELARQLREAIVSSGGHHELQMPP